MIKIQELQNKLLELNSTNEDSRQLIKKFNEIIFKLEESIRFSERMKENPKPRPGYLDHLVLSDEEVKSTKVLIKAYGYMIKQLKNNIRVCKIIRNVLRQQLRPSRRKFYNARDALPNYKKALKFDTFLEQAIQTSDYALWLNYFQSEGNSLANELYGLVSRAYELQEKAYSQKNGIKVRKKAAEIFASGMNSFEKQRLSYKNALSEKRRKSIFKWLRAIFFEGYIENLSRFNSNIQFLEACIETSKLDIAEEESELKITETERQQIDKCIVEVLDKVKAEKVKAVDVATRSRRLTTEEKLYLKRRPWRRSKMALIAIP